MFFCYRPITNLHGSVFYNMSAHSPPELKPHWREAEYNIPLGQKVAPSSKEYKLLGLSSRYFSEANISPVHTSNNVETTGNFVACSFDIVAGVGGVIEFKFLITCVYCDLSSNDFRCNVTT